MESNKLIAEFLGLKIEKDLVYIPKYNSGDWEKISNLKYDSDWNWLMGVVEKIDSLGFVTEISGNIERSFALIGLANSNVSISRVGYGAEFMNKKDATYRAVIEFITWYNEQTKQK